MSGDALLAMRLLKTLGMLAMVAGCVGALMPASLVARRRAAFLLASPGFVVLWFAGLALARGLGHALISPWIAIAMVGATVSINAVYFSVARPARKRAAPAALCALGIIASTAAMIWRGSLYTF